MPVKHNPDANNLITEYIDSMPEWSREICIKLRNIIHKADPKMIEDWKWGPNFYHNGMVCGFGAFKKHVAFVFFQGSQLKDEKNILSEGDNNVHNRRINYINAKEVKDKILIAYIKEAVQINLTGKAIPLSKAGAAEIETPADLQKEIDANALSEYFDMLSYTHRKEYINWVIEAKKEETRKTRIVKTIEMLIKKANLQKSKASR
jgi:uncharacterized protein YdeI (YjbR/CyaY-like superfamily)